MDTIEKEIKLLRTEIKKHNELYFMLQTPVISDEQYDQLIIRLKELEEEYPEYVTKDSPSQNIGGYADTNTFGEVRHKIPMLSLGKVHSVEEYNKWMEDQIAKGVTEFFAEIKIDGLAKSIEYEVGELERSATRGDGKYGEDVTATALSISAIPNRVGDFEGIVRGEAFLTRTSLNTLNTTRSVLGEREYSNVRNAASGILRRKEVSDETTALSFAAYDLVSDDAFIYTKYTQKLKNLESMGFKTAAGLSQSLLVVIENPNDLKEVERAKKEFEEYFKEMEEERPNLDFDIDGIVIKVNKIADQQRLGAKSNIPNWAIAYKFPAIEKMTILQGIEWTMGNKGNITPNARIKEVELVGANVNNITLHNLEEIKRLGIRLNDSIIVSRRGDVIPKVERVLTELRTHEGLDIVPPAECPACGAPTEIKGAFLRCSAGENCSHMGFAKIQNFVRALDIEDFGPKVIQKLLEQGLVEDLADIFDLEVEQIETLERMGERSATKLVNRIQEAKEMPYERIIMGLTIANVGDTTSKDLITKYGDLSGFLNCKQSELVEINGVGDTVAKNIIDWVQNPVNQQVVQKLIDRNVGKTTELQLASNKLEGKTFCFTGKLSNSREFFEDIVIANGGELSAVKKGLDYLVAGEKAGGKLKKASDLGIDVIDEEKFMSMVK